MIAGINEILNENAGVIAVVGRNALDTKVKVYPIAAPSSESLPYLTTSLAGNTPTLYKGLPSSLDAPTFAVNVHATSYDEVTTIAEAVRGALDEKTSVTEAGYSFDRIWYTNEYDRPEMFTPDHPVYVRTLIFNAQIRIT
jgi:hypothetical protein